MLILSTCSWKKKCKNLKYYLVNTFAAIDFYWCQTDDSLDAIGAMGYVNMVNVMNTFMWIISIWVVIQIEALPETMVKYINVTANASNLNIKRIPKLILKSKSSTILYAVKLCWYLLIKYATWKYLKLINSVLHIFFNNSR